MSFNWHKHQQTFVAEVDRVMGVLPCADQKLGIQQELTPVHDVFFGDWVHVMNHDPIVDLSAFYSEIASVVAKNYFIAN
jgi:hypothetical protein